MVRPVGRLSSQGAHILAAGEVEVRAERGYDLAGLRPHSQRVTLGGSAGCSSPARFA